MRGLLLVAVLLLVPTLTRAQALADNSPLLECRVIVTGTDMRSRPSALERCVGEVVVRVTGRADLAEDPRVTDIAAQAPALVQDFAYLDRMTDIPTHDEQGTRDRPFDFVGHVDAAKLEAALSAAGLQAWRSRPTLLALVTVARGGERFALTSDGADGERQRQAILDASRRYGLRVALPEAAQAADLDRLGLRQASGRLVPLRGTLTWRDAAFGWVARWQLGDAVWEVAGASFDDAFRSGVGGAARLLSQR